MTQLGFGGHVGVQRRTRRLVGDHAHLGVVIVDELHTLVIRRVDAEGVLVVNTLTAVPSRTQGELDLDLACIADEIAERVTVFMVGVLAVVSIGADKHQLELERQVGIVCLGLFAVGVREGHDRTLEVHLADTEVVAGRGLQIDGVDAAGLSVSIKAQLVSVGTITVLKVDVEELR